MELSRYHLSADIPAEASPEQVDEIRGGAFEAALRHGASDPKMRLEMLLGEARRALESARLDIWIALAKKLDKESAEVRALAEKLPPDEVEGLLRRALDLLKGRAERGITAKLK